MKGIIGAVDNELIKAALVSTWVALALANNGGWVRRGVNKIGAGMNSSSFDSVIRATPE